MTSAALPLLLANERPLLYLDATLVLNLVLWFVLFFILRALLWGPMLKLIDAREQGFQGSRETANTLQAEAESAKAEYEIAFRNARARAAADRDAARAEALQREAHIVGDARTRANHTLEQRRAEIATQRASLQSQIHAQVPVLASEIATRVLGREVNA